MKDIIIGIATYGNDRIEALENTIHSLNNNTIKPTLIHVYDNEKEDINRYDNGKFYLLPKEDCYFFTCDDDLIYPNTYISDMINAIERTKTIVTHHGRILNGLDRRYYWDHQSFRCLNEVNTERTLDVCGTGVTAFDTSYFNPSNLADSTDYKMADLVFSLEAAKQKKQITLLTHPHDYFIHANIDQFKTIAGTIGRSKTPRQNEIANQIIKLNRP
jgi:hypothetical protein